MLLPVVLLFVVYSVHIDAESRRFIYKGLSQSDLRKARAHGQKAHEEYIAATTNSSEEQKNLQYEDYFMNCNKLGKERERLVEKAVKNVKGSSNYKVLLAIGLQPFVARFLTLPVKEIDDGIKQLCTKFEMQLQCQLGFGESRPQILNRVDQMKVENGNLKFLLEKMCAVTKFNGAPYHCIGEEPHKWTKPCYTQMLNYNYTRYSAGRRIAKLHVDATNDVDALLDSQNETISGLIPLKEQVQTIMKAALGKIAEVEAEKCETLGSVMKCILPAVLSQCGSEVEHDLRTIILVGYLPRERREQLQSHFQGFEVETHPICLALDPSI